ncbi:E3 ubiquitin-protein ligase MPSR1-like [Phoenix dactylifera]|uniref:RING-type E3 ubiquitin transferase n=1 Tax=Phoenix dactylifera TaxID=42345 RepID=A0A8B7CMU2_PHODC|nr:E3 ubiquitin-protein ligase MPSR1-like [Phoenix dactylifera]
MAAESESEVGNAEQRVREAEAEAAGGGGRPRFHPIVVGVMRPPPPRDRGPAPPEGAADRIVLVNPLTQGMVVLQGNPELVAELLSGREDGGSPPASRASIEAMKTVEVGQEEEECPVCLDELAGAEAVVVKEMPCRHRFHGLCIEKWLGMHGSCPVCRFRMPAEEEGGSKKGGGGGGGGEEGEANGDRRRRREVWVTISFRRGESRDRHQVEAGDAVDMEAD